MTTLRVETHHGSWMVAHDLSLGGMLVTTRDIHWPGELLRVRFCLPGETRHIRATCRVVSLAHVPRGMGFALQFLRLHADAQLQLHRYVDSRPEDEPADESVSAQVQTWVRRIVEDCAQLGALASS
jgi:hypothetical protein